MIEENLPLTPRMQRTLMRAAGLARARGHGYLGNEHVILALVDDPNGIAGGVLQRLDCADAVRAESLGSSRAMATRLRASKSSGSDRVTLRNAEQ